MTTEVTAMDEHERVLDYAYDMLSDGEKASFEAHLATCSRCRVELAATGHVRQVTRAALPMIEPGARLTGALHAQLMHEAAQRKPAGKMLPFMRRVLKHPAYAAAASVLIIGGAVGVQWSRGRLFMPVPGAAAPAKSGAAAPGAAASVQAPASTAAEAPAANADKVLSPRPVPKGKASNAYDTSSGGKSIEGTGEYAHEEKSADPLAGPSKDAYRPDGNAGPAKKPMQQKEEVARRPVERSAPARKPSDALDDLIASDERKSRDVEREGAEKSKVGSSGPAPIQPRAASAGPQAPPATPAAPRATAVKTDSDSSIVGGIGRTGASAEAPGGRLDDERERATLLAHDGRCDDAVAAYASLEQRVQLTSTERGNYAGCLRTVRMAASREQAKKKQQSPARAKAMKAVPTPQSAETEPRR